MFRSNLAALTFAALAAIPATMPAAAHEHGNAPRTINIVGHGEMKMAPDLAVITLGVMNSAATAREALDANNAAMNSVMAGLKSAGIAANDIQTSNFSISPRYDYGQDNRQPPRVVAYDVSNTVTITVRKLDTLGAVLDQTVSQGSNQINGIMFSVADPGPAQDEARKLAVADAQAQGQAVRGRGRHWPWRYSLLYPRPLGIPRRRRLTQDHAGRSGIGCADRPRRTNRRCRR